MIENLCGGCQGEEIMREIEKVLMEQTQMVTHSQPGLNTQVPEPRESVPASPVRVSQCVDLGEVTTQVAGQEVKLTLDYIQ